MNTNESPNLNRVEHTGDACPVEGDTQVMVWLQGDPSHGLVGPAKHFAWGLRGELGRISHYAVV